MFKAGDKVKKKDGSVFSNAKAVLTVEKMSGHDVWFRGTGTHSHKDYLELAVPLEGQGSERPDSDHYHEGGIDVWQFADANFDYDELFGFHKINVIKYIARFGKKNGRNIRDLEKARAVLDEMIRMELSK